jgi:dihydroorotate dehydrogenase electron transfer subunit
VKSDHRAILERRECFSPGLFSVTFKAPDLAGSVEPGQFAMLEIPERVRPYLRRAYSVADAHADRGTVEFLIKTVGPGTGALEELTDQSSVRLLAPLGNRFSIADLKTGSAIAIVAGGIGAAPFPLLLRRLSAAKVESDLFLGGRRARDLAFRNRFSADAGARNTYLTTEDGSLGEKAFVTEIFQEMARKKKYERVFACGPMPMFAALAAIVQELGLDAQFSTEADMGCGFGVCLGCVIPGREKPFLVSCTEGPILTPDKIAWERLRR